MKRATRFGLALYRSLARALLPGAFRREYGEELVQAVAARLAAAHGGLASWTALAAEVADLVRTALREWRGTAAGLVAERRNERGTREAVMEDAWAELKVTLRALARRPGFALGVTLTIGLGIGATTAIYGVVDGVVLRPLPYEDPSGLVAIGAPADAATPDAATNLQALTDISSEVYKRYHERARAFAELAALDPYMVTLSNADGAEEQIPGVRVSPELFDMLGVSPVLGRAFLPEEYAVSTDGVAMISYEYWQSRYGGDPDVLGQAIATLPSSGPRPIIVGVLPRAFRLPETFFGPGELPQVYAPLRLADPRPGVVLLFPVQGLGRLAPTSTLEQARAEAEQLHGEISLELAELPRLRGLQSRGIGVNDLHDQTVGATGRSLWVFLGAAALLLLLTSMNAASLLLARALDRTRELGVRVSLGAGRGRVVRLLLAEAGTLSVIGGAIGVALAYGGVAAFLRLAPPSIPRLDSVAVDGRVLFAATLMTLATAVGAGLLPALRLTARRPWEGLQRGGRTASDTSTGARTVLVGGQLALSVVLLSAAGLLLTSFMRLRSMDPGFEADGLVVVRTATRGPQRFEGSQAALLGQAWERVQDAVSDVSGVASAAMANTLPLQAPSWAPRLLLPGDDPEMVREGIAGYVVTAGYHETMGTRVIEGRDLEPSDGLDAEPVILVNEEFVRTQLGGSEALGTLVTRTREGPAAGGEQVAMRIVGVVEDVVQARVEDGPRPAVYLPYGQAEPSQLVSFWTVVRTAVAPESLAPALRSALGSVDRWPRTVATMRSHLSESRASPRFQASLIGAFALIAMLLAAAGLHGSLTHSVRSRQRELGVRMALGADRSSVLRMVLGQGMLVTAVGLALGLSGTLALSRVLASFLYDVRPYDPPTLLVVAGVLTLVAAAACLSPARRATAVDPVKVLSAD